MPLIHKFLSTFYRPLRLSNVILRRIGLKTPNRLRVLNYHDIAPKEESKFIAQLHWLAKIWNFIAPETFAAMLQGELPIEGDNLLITFDDGFSSNRKITEEILNPLGIKAIFFVVLDFLNIQSDKVAKQFISEKMYIDIPQDKLPAHWSNMCLNDIKYLIDTGHTIGAHTLTHARLSQVYSANLLENEIISSADRLEQIFGIKVEHFAYPFGDLESFSPAALAVSKMRFPFIYTTLRGDNADNLIPWGIRRDGIEPKDPLRLVGTFLEGGADLWYAKHLAKYIRWGGKK